MVNQKTDTTAFHANGPHPAAQLPDSDEQEAPEVVDERI
jgi:hypothetical protein